MERVRLRENVVVNVPLCAFVNVTCPSSCVVRMCVIYDQNSRAFCPQRITKKNKKQVINRNWRQRTGRMHGQYKQTHHRFFLGGKKQRKKNPQIDRGYPF